MRNEGFRGSHCGSVRQFSKHLPSSSLIHEVFPRLDGGVRPWRFALSSAALSSRCAYMILSSSLRLRKMQQYLLCMGSRKAECHNTRLPCTKVDHDPTTLFVQGGVAFNTTTTVGINVYNQVSLNSLPSSSQLSVAQGYDTARAKKAQPGAGCLC